MKKDDNKKRRLYYDLTERQVYKIVAILEVIFGIIMVSRIVTNWSNEQLLEQRGIDITITIMSTITFLFLGMCGLGVFVWMILWENPGKQRYLFKREHDEIIVPKVREKFGLSSDFIEVLSKEDQLLHYYVKETEDGISISIRDNSGEELESERITNYNYFDLHYEPKV